MSRTHYQTPPRRHSELVPHPLVPAPPRDDQSRTRTRGSGSSSGSAATTPPSTSTASFSSSSSSLSASSASSPATVACRHRHKRSRRSSPVPPPSPSPATLLAAWRARTAQQHQDTQQRLATHPSPGAIPWIHHSIAADAFLMTMAAYPACIDAAIIALAMTYVDECLLHDDGSGDETQPPACFVYEALACLLFAVRFESQSLDHWFGDDDFFALAHAVAKAAERRAGLPAAAAPPTAAQIQAIQLRLLARRLRHDVWRGTAAEWMRLLLGEMHGGGPAVPVPVPAAAATCFRPFAAPEATPTLTPTNAEVGVALRRLPLQDQILLRALRDPRFVAWSPERLGAACLALAATLPQATGDLLDDRLPALLRRFHPSKEVDGATDHTADCLFRYDVNLLRQSVAGRKPQSKPSA